MSPKRYKLTACEVMFREICKCAAKCGNIIDITYMKKGLHDIGEKKMNTELQEEVDRTDTSKYEAILLCYGLCNNGIRNLHSPLPIIAPRAHDCITLLMGSKEKYAKYFHSNPGTFFLSSGWIERGIEIDGSVSSQLGIGKTYEEYAELYGEDNAEYLFEMLGSLLVHYKKVSFINTQVGSIELYRKKAMEMAEGNQWEQEEIDGDTGLIFRLLNGDWDPSEFLVIPPEHKISPSNDDSIITYI